MSPKTSKDRPLREALRDSEVPPETLARQWEAIANRVVSSPPAAPWRWYGIGAVAVAAMALVLAPRSGPQKPALSERVLWPNTAAVFSLSDGARLTLAAHTLATVHDVNPQDVRVRMRAGTASFDVPKRGGRTFVVETPSAEVRVVGTRFTVSVMEDGRDNAVQVSVAEGAVQVLPQDGASVLVRAGQTWPQPIAAPEPPSATSGPYAQEPAAGLTPSPAPPNPISGGRPPTPPPLVAARSPQAVSSKRPSLAAEADRLFEAGSHALVNDDAREAARAFDQLRRQYPRHPSAGVAAFALGRLLLERLNDPRAAADVLSETLALPGGSPLREDIEARLVQALEASKQLDRCRVARASYLRNYPHGRHATAVSRRCGL